MAESEAASRSDSSASGILVGGNERHGPAAPPLLLRLGFEPAREPPRESQDGLGMAAQQGLGLLARQPGDRAVAHRAHRGGPRPTGQDRELAQALPPPHLVDQHLLAVLVLADDHQPAAGDEVEAVARLPLAADHMAARDEEPLEIAEDLVDRRLRQVLEQAGGGQKGSGLREAGRGREIGMRTLLRRSANCRVKSPHLPGAQRVCW